MRIPIYLAVGALLVRATEAQVPPPIPLRTLGTILATGTSPVGALVDIRPLSDGRVLVNDPQKRQLLLYDASLSNPIVVADTTSSTQKAYGKGGASITPYLADSTLFIDQTSLAVLVVDPSGKIARTFAVPRAADITFMTRPTVYGNPGFDGKSGLIYRKPVLSLAAPRGAGAPVTMRQDSAFIVRADIATHAIDTIGAIRLSGSNTTTTIGADGRISTKRIMNPVPTVDDWTVASDGSVALIRGGDFHIDWVSPDGTKSSSPRIPFDWKHLTDSAKAAMIDSIKAIYAAEPESLTTTVDGVKRTIARPPIPDVVEPSELPDYMPPFGPVLPPFFVARADADGNVWIPINGPGLRRTPAYDVVNRKGALVDRIQLLPGFTLLGFGPGVVYVSSRNDQGVGVLSRVRIH